MDNRVKELILGYDLCNDYIQMSCYNQKTQDMDTICYIGEKMLDRIPTVLCRLYGDQTWVCGYEAWKAVNANRGILVGDFVSGLEDEKTLDVGGDGYSSAELTRIFIQESLKLVTKYYPHWQVGKLTISVEKLGKHTVQALKPLCEAMDFDESHLSVINHVSAYEYYALNQKKELWQHDVGLFDYSKRGMTYYHLSISKKRNPLAVMATTIPLAEFFDGSEIGQTAPPELDRRFLEVVRNVTANKIISTVYLTGEGFEGDWAKISLKNLCHHRKGFIGSNIFSRGACYYSLTAAGLLSKSQFTALNEDVVSKTIYIRGNSERETVNKEIVKAGQVWYDVEAEVSFIPDDMDHVTLHLADYLTQRERSVQVSLKDFETGDGRADKTRVLKLKMSFDSPSECRVHVEDLGFGEFYPPSDKISEQTIHIYDDSLNDKEVHEPGRIIFIEGPLNTVPYYFNLSGMRVYTLEQLCYYIYHHIYTFNEESFDDTLFYWIEKNLDEKGLVKRLREAKKNKRTLKEMVRLLLMYVDYYSKEEINGLQKIIEEMEARNPIESRKTEGDNYLRYGRTLEALAVYKKVERMMEESDDLVTNEFRGNVIHNIGIAFARLANGEAALQCFKKAHELNHSASSRDAWLITLKMLGRDTEMIEETGNMTLAPEVVEGISQKMNEGQKAFEQGDTFEIFEQLREISSESQWEEVLPEILGWLEKQKEEYRH